MSEDSGQNDQAIRGLPDPLRCLLDPATYDHPVESVELVETHISWVFLTGHYAYKVKKPVQLPFVDFGSLERRRTSCEDELRLNRRLAPELYLGLVTLGGADGTVRPGGTPAIEYAVKMRQFPETERLDRVLEDGRLQAAMIRDFAERMADFHASLPSVGGAAEDAGSPELDAMRANLEETLAALEDGERALLDPCRTWIEVHADRLEERARVRRAAGCVRDCHGDLHLENLVLLDGRVVAFDALEFNERLRQIDVIDEVAFLSMDLTARGHADLAAVWLNRYLEVTGDYGGLALIDAYRMHRALVRGKVRAIRRGQRERPRQDGERPYLELAASLAAPRRPLLAITRGLSGSGKTHIAQALVPAANCVSVRSDVERKRLHGLDPSARSHSGIGTGLYTDDASERTYAALETAAAAALEGGVDIIVDASFLARAERDRFHALAVRANARFAMLDCRAPEPVLRERIVARAARGGDASEADTAVLDHQLATADPVASDEQRYCVAVDTTAEPDAAALAARLEAAAG